MKYPPSPKSDHVDDLHGVCISDPYRWLEDIDSQETRHWIEAQNQLTSDYMEDIPARQEITKRLTELWNYEKFGVPRCCNGRYFFTRNDGLQNQSVLYWMESLEDEPKVLLDPNQLSKDGTVALIEFTISDDGRLLAYGVSASGSDWQEWRVRAVDTGKDLDDHLRWVKFSIPAWTSDNQGLFYSRYDEPGEGQAFKDANYYHKLYYHRLGTSQEEDELIYERPDHKEWGFLPQVSEDGRYLLVNVWQGTHRENGVFYKDLQVEDSAVVPLLQDFDATYTFVANQGTTFYFFTDLDAPMARLVAIDITAPARANWLEVIPEGADALESVHRVGGGFFAIYMHDAYHRVARFALDGKPLGEVDLPGMGSVLGFEGKEGARETFYHFASFTTPGSIYRYDIQTAKSAIIRWPEVPFDPKVYVTKQVFYNSKDGTRIPMFICHKRGLDLDGDNPTYLYGYGGFNIPQLPNFSPAVLAWMEMGGVFAMANLRGGGEYGKGWHSGGMLHNKQNVFDDFIAAAEWLIDQKYTRTPRLAISGRSNGGLLIGACLTQRPDLYGACIPIVGVLDMLRFHKFTIGWAWVSDYGSPEDSEEFETLLAYSPYHNIQDGAAYPPTLITTGDHDDRVYPAHSFKFAAALQAAQAGTAPVLIRIDTKAGHGMGKPTAKLIEETADQWSFLVKALRM